MVNTTVFESEIVNDLTAELSGEGSFNKNILTVKVRVAVKELIEMRNYFATSMTDEQIEADIERFYPQVMNVARYDYNMSGAEGETSHSENGIQRMFIDRKSLWNGVVPFAGVGR